MREWHKALEKTWGVGPHRTRAMFAEPLSGHWRAVARLPLFTRLNHGTPNKMAATAGKMSSSRVIAVAAERKAI